MSKYISKNEPHKLAPPVYMRPRASLAALQWAAERANMSYGSFTLHLSPEEEARIQLEYEDMMRQRKVKMAQRVGIVFSD